MHILFSVYWADDQPLTKAYLAGLILFGMLVAWRREKR